MKRGDVAFQSYCLSCHTPTFHTGEQFRMSWLGRTVYDYFKVVKTTMPEDNPGGLTDDEYTLRARLHLPDERLSNGRRLAPRGHARDEEHPDLRASARTRSNPRRR